LKFISQNVAQLFRLITQRVWKRQSRSHCESRRPAPDFTLAKVFARAMPKRGGAAAKRKALEWTPPGVAGIDEAARGTLIGPLAVAVVCIPAEPFPGSDELRDSKSFTTDAAKVRREQLAAAVRAHCSWALALVPARAVEALNPTGATMAAAHACLDVLTRRPEARKTPHARLVKVTDHGGPPVALERIIMDGSVWKPPYLADDGAEVPAECVKKADDRFRCVAAASILAKTTRDRWMRDLLAAHPRFLAPYDMDKRLGYWTPAHRDAIAAHGFTQWHRRNYAPAKVDWARGETPAWSAAAAEGRVHASGTRPTEPEDESEEARALATALNVRWAAELRRGPEEYRSHGELELLEE
jgi:ribonuclease HII